MKLYKSFLIAAACATGAFMASCSQDGSWDKASIEQAAYTFNAASSSYTYGPEDETPATVDVIVTRNTTSGAATIPLSVKVSDPDLVSCDTVAKFLDGQNQAVVKMAISRQLEIGENAEASFTINPEDYGVKVEVKPTEPEALPDEYTKEDSIAHEKALAAYKDSLNTYNVYKNKMTYYKLVTTVSVSKDYSWTSIGMATFTDDALASLYGADPVTFNVEIEVCDQVENYFRLKNPYGEDYPYNEDGDFDADNDYYFYIHAEEPDFVYAMPQTLGVDWGDGEFTLADYAGYYLANGYDAETVKARGMGGSFADGVITWPAGMMVCGFGGAISYVANNNGKFRVILPGYSVADYTANVAYAGRFIDPENNTTVHAEVELGADVAYAYVGVVAGAPSEDGVAVVEGMTAENVIEVKESDKVELALPETPSEDGVYTIYVVAFDKEGEAQEFGFAKFVASAEGGPVATNWIPAYVGTFQYTVLFTNEDGSPYDDEGIVLYVDEDDESHFCIGDEELGVFYGVPFEFYMREDGTLAFNDQDTGAKTAKGELFITDWSVHAAEYAEAHPEEDSGVATPGYYENGVFNFNTAYYAGDDWYGWATSETGFETFTITDRAESKAINSSKARKAAAKKNFNGKAKAHRNGRSRKWGAPVKPAHRRFVTIMK